jgi:NADH dehydrogenase
MASLGHARGLGEVFGVPIYGVLAWWVRRTYYLIQMPRWSRRLRILMDWTLALFFRPDIVKVDLARLVDLERRCCPFLRFRSRSPTAMPSITPRTPRRSPSSPAWSTSSAAAAPSCASG